MLSNEAIAQYRYYTETPWGRMFYRLAHTQIERHLEYIEDKQSNINIIDFGSGFGITSRYFARKHYVISIEPDSNMIPEEYMADYKPIIGSLDILKQIEAKTVDLLICHNVLEYIDLQEIYLREFFRILKDDGFLSLICHNIAGKVIATAVFNENPSKAYRILNGAEAAESDIFGKINYIQKEKLEELLIKENCIIKNDYGIRTLFGIVKNNQIKYHSEWDQQMFELEMILSDQYPYKEIAFWKHFIIKKKNSA